MTRHRFPSPTNAILFTLVSLLCFAAVEAPAQSFTTLANFDGIRSAVPRGPLVQGVDGNFYGTSFGGGNNPFGSVFKVTPAGVLTTLYQFCSQMNCVDGANPEAGLILGSDANFYGTTLAGGIHDQGSVFKINAAGILTTIYSFCSLPNCTDGALPIGVIQASDGNLYGTTIVSDIIVGTFFKLTPGGVLTTLHTFCLQACNDGTNPFSGPVQAADGNFYGTTENGGSRNEGTVYKITPDGVFTTLYTFCSVGNCSDGSVVPAGLIQGRDGNLYGETSAGGNTSCDFQGCGTAFKITLAGALTTFHIFCDPTNCNDGSNPGVFIQATDGDLYGGAATGGEYGDGTLFQFSGRTLTTLQALAGIDGSNPAEGLVQGTDGNFYGTTRSGGSDGYGTVFTAATGLSPFVKTVPTIGHVGGRVIILGNHLTGATSVTFNGVPATFTVASDTGIRVTVPSGATTGNVQVTTPSGTLTSNVVFRVR